MFQNFFFNFQHIFKIAADINCGIYGESIELNKSGYKFVKSWLEFFIRYLLPRFSFLTYYFEPTILEIQEL